jgi:hypothetical protein
MFINKIVIVRYEFLTTMNTKIVVFWDVTSCSLVKRYLHFGETYCLSFKAEEYAAWENEVTDTGKEKETGLLP